MCEASGGSRSAGFARLLSLTGRAITTIVAPARLRSTTASATVIVVFISCCGVKAGHQPEKDAPHLWRIGRAIAQQDAEAWVKAARWSPTGDSITGPWTSSTINWPRVASSGAFHCRHLLPFLAGAGTTAHLPRHQCRGDPGTSLQGSGLPSHDPCRSGTVFVSRDLDLWAYQRDVTLDFSQPGKANRQRSCSSVPAITARLTEARFEVHLTKARGIFGRGAEPFEAKLVMSPDGKAVWTCTDPGRDRKWSRSSRSRRPGPPSGRSLQRSTNPNQWSIVHFRRRRRRGQPTERAPCCPSVPHPRDWDSGTDIQDGELSSARLGLGETQSQSAAHPNAVSLDLPGVLGLLLADAQLSAVCRQSTQLPTAAYRHSDPKATVWLPRSRNDMRPKRARTRPDSESASPKGTWPTMSEASLMEIIRLDLLKAENRGAIPLGSANKIKYFWNFVGFGPKPSKHPGQHGVSLGRWDAQASYDRGHPHEARSLRYRLLPLECRPAHAGRPHRRCRSWILLGVVT
jgi:hypothetical protein